jgi:hypothetical protein
MSRRLETKLAILVAGLLLAVAAPGRALTVVGTVERVEWTNPHAYVYLLVKDDKGVTQEWAIEINSPNFLKHNGWTSTTVKAGDTITATGGRAKDGARSMRCTGVKLANGLELRS